MKLTLVFAVCLICSIADALRTHPTTQIGRFDLWNLMDKLFPSLRPTSPSTIIPPMHPEVLPALPDLKTETLPPETPPVPDVLPDHKVVTDHTHLVTDHEQTTDHNLVTDHGLATNPDVVTEKVTSHPPSGTISTEPTTQGRHGKDLINKEASQIVDQITDILLILPKNVVTLISVIIPIVGNIINLIKEHFKIGALQQLLL